MFGKIEEWLKGRKAYLLSAIVIVLAVLSAVQGWFPPEANGVAGAVGLMVAALRGAIGKVEDMLRQVQRDVKAVRPRRR